MQSKNDMSSIPEAWLRTFPENLHTQLVRIEQQLGCSSFFPTKENLYTALSFFPPPQTKVIIVGQDPYILERQAHGLSFSVSDPTAKFPPSLRNIFKELSRDCNLDLSKLLTHPNLVPWAKQGVLLLNMVLSVKPGHSNSHKNLGWQPITAHIFQQALQQSPAVSIILWGKDAQKLLSYRTEHPQHQWLTGAHPSPLGAHQGFWNGDYFSKTNIFLEQHGIQPIDWRTY